MSSYALVNVILNFVAADKPCVLREYFLYCTELPCTVWEYTTPVKSDTAIGLYLFATVSKYSILVTLYVAGKAKACRF